MPSPALPHMRAVAIVGSYAIAAAALLTSVPAAATAQRLEAPRTEAACDYRRCAYNIIAAPHGLKVVRGEREERVATLGFLWTRDISDAFEGEGFAAAKAAVRTRRWAALFTDVGLGLLVAGAASAATDGLDESSAGLMLGGAASLGLSVPIQFLADTHLSRAVWQHNARYAGGTR